MIKPAITAVTSPVTAAATAGSPRPEAELITKVPSWPTPTTAATPAATRCIPSCSA